MAKYVVSLLAVADGQAASIVRELKRTGLKSAYARHSAYVGEMVIAIRANTKAEVKRAIRIARKAGYGSDLCFDALDYTK